MEEPARLIIVTKLMTLRTLFFLFLASPTILLANPLLPEYSRGYDPQRDPFADGRTAIQLAQASQRRVLIEVGGNWCSWCHKLETFIKTHANVHEQLHKHFVVLKVNVSEENDNQAFLDGLPKMHGYPHMFVADDEGKIIYSQDTTEFLENKQYSVQRILTFIDKWKRQ